MDWGIKPGFVDQAIKRTASGWYEAGHQATPKKNLRSGGQKNPQKVYTQFLKHYVQACGKDLYKIKSSRIQYNVIKTDLVSNKSIPLTIDILSPITQLR